MQGIQISSNLRFHELFADFMEDFQQLYWLLNVQSVSFDFHIHKNAKQIEDQLEQLRVDVPALEMISASFWKPGIFPKFAPLLKSDEWSYLIGIQGFEDKAVMAAQDLAERNYLTRSFFDFVEHNEICAILKVTDGWWEVYAHRKFAIEKLCVQIPCQHVDSLKWRFRGL
jgi:hypothetical protein